MSGAAAGGGGHARHKIKLVVVMVAVLECWLRWVELSKHSY